MECGKESSLEQRWVQILFRNTWWSCKSKDVVKEVTSNFPSKGMFIAQWVMVWGPLTWCSRTSLVFIRGSKTYRYFDEVLQQHMLPSLGKVSIFTFSTGQFTTSSRRFSLDFSEVNSLQRASRSLRKKVANISHSQNNWGFY